MKAEKITELKSLIKQAMAESSVPGLAVGIWFDGQEYTEGFGVTSVENPLPVDADTLFQVGSITKTITGTAVMRLVESGEIDLDEPLRTYLPELRLADETVTENVTMRHLLTHTGGWAGDYFAETGMGEDALAKYVADMVDLPQLAPVGEVWAYNNAGFSLAGRVIEVVTGKTYEEALQEYVLSPLGMNNSFLFANDAISRRVVVGHFSQAGGPEPKVSRPWALTRSAHAAGGVISSVRDQLRYARFHLGDGTAEDGTQILTAETIAVMQEARVKANVGNQFGITWFVREIGGTKIVRHGGATNDQMATLLLVPGRDFALSMLTNSNRGEEIYARITKWVLEEVLDLVEAELGLLTLDESELSAYVGAYEAQMGKLVLYVENGDLMAQYVPKGGFPDQDSPPPPAPPPSRLIFTAADEVMALDPPLQSMRADFIRHPDGRVRWLRTSRLHEPV